MAWTGPYNGDFIHGVIGFDIGYQVGGRIKGAENSFGRSLYRLGILSFDGDPVTLAFIGQRDLETPREQRKTAISFPAHHEVIT
jgi:hypothetical protein